MTRYVLTKEQLGDVPPFTVGTAVLNPETFTVALKFNFCIAHVSLEAFGRVATVISPTLWKARLRYRNGREIHLRVAANPYTGDPPPEWFVPKPPEPPFVHSDGYILPLEVVTFRCSHIPEASDTWIYEEVNP